MINTELFRRCLGISGLGVALTLTACATQAPAPQQQNQAQADGGPAFAVANATADALTAPREPGSAQNARMFHQSGQASYYAARFQGHRTSSGERYNSRLLTAAHRTLPLGSYVRVTDMATSKSVIVKINDRGPFGHSHRIIDLSYAAASALGLRRAGVADVRIEALPRTQALAQMQASLG
jgi:rare lipoprotein A